MSIKDKVFDTDERELEYPVETQIVEGVQGIDVHIVSCTENPYKGMVNMALATWGSDIDSWDKLDPDERFKVTKQVIERKALPLGKESPSFLFAISGVTRSSFDQIARQRIGSTFSSLGWNNIHTRNSFRIPNEIVENDEYRIYKAKIVDCVNYCKEVYKSMIEGGISWQSAREVLNMGLLHWFHFNISYEALLSFCSRRCCFAEKEDTVAVAWLMRERVREKFPLLATYLRPGCDGAGRCTYQSDGSLPGEMGTLFESCGRNPLKLNEPEKIKVDFHRPSTRKGDLEVDLNIRIPWSIEDKAPAEYKHLSDKDKALFNEC